MHLVKCFDRMGMFKRIASMFAVLLHITKAEKGSLLCMKGKKLVQNN